MSGVAWRGAGANAGYIARTLRLIWRAAGGLALLWAALLLVQGLLPVAVVYGSGLLVDALAASVAAGSGALQPLLAPAALILGALLFGELLGVAAGWLSALMGERVQDHVRAVIHHKSAEVDLAFYESSEFYDHLHRARDGAGDRSLALLTGLGELAQNAVTLAAMAGLLLPYGLWLPALLILSTLPALLVLLRVNRGYHRWWERTTSDRRWADYYDEVLLSGETAPEVRLLGLGSPYSAIYQRLRGRLRRQHTGLIARHSAAQFGAGLITVLLTAPAVAWMVWQTLSGAASLGDLVRFYQAFTRGQGLMRALLGNAGQIYGTTLFLRSLFAFLDLEPRVTGPAAPLPVPAQLREGIRFRNVSFGYPGSERPALRAFDLFIPAGQLAAVVGVNGAGKSTLVKLLCRFYDPDEGSIEIDGVDIKQFALDDLRRAIAVLFQLPVRYQATAAENIALGDLKRTADAEGVEAAARSAGAHGLIVRLPHSYDTLLGRAFVDGADLSGGEWQRLALARACYRGSPIVALDEPTSFMDSWAEADWLGRFRAVMAGRTAIIITHRFTTAMRADRIYVVDEGCVAEAGTHAELLALGGRYARSWAAQVSADTLPDGQPCPYEQPLAVEGSLNA